MKLRLLSSALLIAVLCAGFAGADVLWDQTTPDPTGQGFANIIAGAPPFGLSVYAVDDIRVHDVWHVDSYTLTFWGIDQAWYLGAFQATLSVFEKTGSLPSPTDNPTAEILVNITAGQSEIIDGNVVTTLTAGGLDLMLDPGDYWIGLTPHASMQRWDFQSWRASANAWGDNAAQYDLSFGSWGSTNGMDGCFKLEGTILVVPTETKSFGAVKEIFGN